MRKIVGIIALACAVALFSMTTITIAEAQSGIVTSHKTGAKARVGAHFAAMFQAYIDDLESNHGAIIRNMGGIRRGHCGSASLHPCGKALDVCQLSRGRVDSRCHLPDRQEIAKVAAAHGLFEGGRWCHSDYGHAQVGLTAADCGTTFAARGHMIHHYRHTRLARG